MNAPHKASAGRVLACTVPESPHSVRSYAVDSGCRSCLIALIATAINVPERCVLGLEDGVRRKAPVAALLRVREYLDEFDPLRVRAEQALLPLVGAR